MTYYIIICLGIFLYGLVTALEDVAIMRGRGGEPTYPYPPILAIVGLFIVAFIPPFNIMMLAITAIYRAGGDGK